MKRAFLLLLPILFIIVFPVFAQEGGDAVTDDEVNEVAREVYCPVCESTPLDVCQTKACADWRELIRTQLSEGKSQEEIFDYFATQYGDRVLATPRAQGLNLIVWIVPLVALLVGAFIFSRYLRSLRLASAEGNTAIPDDPDNTSQPTKDDYAARIEEELKKG